MREDGSVEAITCAVEDGTLEAGSTPSRPCPVPWFAGCGGISALVISALDTIEEDVSVTSARTGGVAFGTGRADWEGAADAEVICAACTWTVFARTGLSGSDEPGIAAMAWVWITPLVSGAGSGFACCGGNAAVAAATTDGRVAGGAERTAGASDGSGGAAEATCRAPLT